jgi:hypothetical protein
VAVDPEDRRSRRVRITDAGRDLLVAALPVWRATHAEIDQLLPDADPGRLRADLLAAVMTNPEAQPDACPLLSSALFLLPQGAYRAL